MSEQKPAQKLSVIAAPLSKRIQIDDVRLIESRTTQSLREGGETPENVENGFNAKAVLVSGPQSLIRVTAQFQVRARYPEAESDKPAISIDATFLLTYSFKPIDGVSDEQLDAFARMNGIYNAWPYWREFVQATTARMGLPSLVLPVLTGTTLEAVYVKKAADEAEEKASAAPSDIATSESDIHQ